MYFYSFTALFVHFFVKRLIFGYHQRVAVVAAVNLIYPKDPQIVPYLLGNAPTSKLPGGMALFVGL